MCTAHFRFDLQLVKDILAKTQLLNISFLGTDFNFIGSHPFLCGLNVTGKPNRLYFSVCALSVVTAALQIIMFHDIHEMIILSTIPTLKLNLNSLTSKITLNVIVKFAFP